MKTKAFTKQFLKPFLIILIEFDDLCLLMEIVYL
jgi:hypothetical protein